MKRREFITLLPQSQLVSSQSADRAGTSLRPLARHLAPVVEASPSVADSVPYHYYLLLYRACRRRCCMRTPGATYRRRRDIRRDEAGVGVRVRVRWLSRWERGSRDCSMAWA